jgi:hypothetical protein
MRNRRRFLKIGAAALGAPTLSLTVFAETKGTYTTIDPPGSNYTADPPGSNYTAREVRRDQRTRGQRSPRA